MKNLLRYIPIYTVAFGLLLGGIFAAGETKAQQMCGPIETITNSLLGGYNEMPFYEGKLHDGRPFILFVSVGGITQTVPPREVKLGDTFTLVFIATHPQTGQQVMCVATTGEDIHPYKAPEEKLDPTSYKDAKGWGGIEGTERSG